MVIFLSFFFVIDLESLYSNISQIVVLPQVDPGSIISDQFLCYDSLASDLTVDLSIGNKKFTAYTMDLSEKYIEINGDYRT